MSNHTQTAPVVFQFQSQEVRTVNVDGETWFIAADVADVLGYPKTNDLTRNLEDYEKGAHNVRTLGGEQKVTIINESGIYSAVLKSRKPEAKVFKKWVTCEILPAIRKTGGYQIQQHSTDNATWTYLGHMIILTMHGQHWVKMQSLANAMFYLGDIPSNFYKYAKGHDYLYVHYQDESEQVGNPRVSTQKQRAYYRYLPLSAVYNIANRDSRGLTAISQLNRHLASIGKQPASQPTKAPVDHFAGLPAGRYLVVVENGEATLRDVSAYSIVNPEASEVLRRNMHLLEQQFRAFRGEASEACMGTPLASLPECAV